MKAYFGAGGGLGQTPMNYTDLRPGVKSGKKKISALSIKKRKVVQSLTKNICKKNTQFLFDRRRFNLFARTGYLETMSLGY